jgi:outer membrane lipoprotein carrier protein
MVNKQDGIDEKQNGELWIKGDKYKLVLPGIERYSDGSTLWTFLTEDDECQITSVGNDEDETSFSPSQMLNIYEHGFNYTYEGKKKPNGVEVDQIKLFPEKGGKPYHSIILQVKSSSNQLYRLIVKGKDGNTYTYTLSEQSPNPEVSDAFFTLNTDDIGDVIDLRE